MKRIILILTALILTFTLGFGEGEKQLKKIALTFDDGPNKKVTPELLKLLKQNNIKATFFVMGQNAKRNSDLLKQEYEEGHLIANHSYTHINFAKSNMKDVKSELSKTQNVIAEVVGKEPTFFRPPHGGLTKTQKKQLDEEMGLKSVMWNVSPGDWEKKSTPQSISDFLVKNARPNGIVLLHDLNKTVEALKTAIPKLKEKGYIFVTVDEIRGEEGWKN